MRSHADTIPEATPEFSAHSTLAYLENHDNSTVDKVNLTSPIHPPKNRRGSSPLQTQIQAVMPVNHACSRDLVAFSLPWSVPQHARLMFMSNVARIHPGPGYTREGNSRNWRLRTCVACIPHQHPRIPGLVYHFAQPCWIRETWFACLQHIFWLRHPWPVHGVNSSVLRPSC